MGYKLKAEYWLKSETDKVQEIVLMPKFWSTTWTALTLKTALEELGLTYTADQCGEILDELKVRNVMTED